MRPGPVRVVGGFADLPKDRASLHPDPSRGQP